MCEGLPFVKNCRYRYSSQAPHIPRDTAHMPVIQSPVRVPYRSKFVRKRVTAGWDANSSRGRTDGPSAEYTYPASNASREPHERGKNHRTRRSGMGMAERIEFLNDNLTRFFPSEPVKMPQVPFRLVNAHQLARPFRKSADARPEYSTARDSPRPPRRFLRRHQVSARPP
jgi:hypothetical protein